MHKYLKNQITMVTDVSPPGNGSVESISDESDEIGDSQKGILYILKG